jgi:hypothetical protein
MEYLTAPNSVAVVQPPEEDDSDLDIFNVNYYYKENEQVYGAFSLLELIHLDIKENTPLAINSPTNWQFAGEIDDLMDTITRLSALEKEEYEAELQKIKNELSLNKQELEEVIEEQEKEISDLEKENERLRQTPPEDISKEALLAQINAFKEALLHESRQNYTKDYPSVSNKLLDKVAKYNHTAEQFISLLNGLSDKTQKWLGDATMDFRAKNEILSAIRNTIVYGNHFNNTFYYVTSNSPQQKEIGRIFKEKPTEILSGDMLTGYYENGELKFEMSGNTRCYKHSYPLWESWLNGKIEIKYNELDNTITLKRKREVLRSRVCFGLRLSDFVVFYPAEIEIIQTTGILYGDRISGSYGVTSNSENYNEIGYIFKEKPSQLLPIGITGYYENGILQFVDAKGAICEKRPYQLWESWLNGKIEIKYV